MSKVEFFICYSVWSLIQSSFKMLTPLGIKYPGPVDTNPIRPAEAVFVPGKVEWARYISRQCPIGEETVSATVWLAWSTSANFDPSGNCLATAQGESTYSSHSGRPRRAKAQCLPGAELWQFPVLHRDGWACNSQLVIPLLSGSGIILLFLSILMLASLSEFHS